MEDCFSDNFYVKRATVCFSEICVLWMLTGYMKLLQHTSGERNQEDDQKAGPFFEPHHEKIGLLHMLQQRRRSAVQYATINHLKTDVRN